MISFGEVIAALRQRAVDFVVTGVWGANYYTGGSLFMTKDQDLFLPPDATNLLRAWQACESVGLSLDCNDEPLDARIVQKRIPEGRERIVRRDGGGGKPRPDVGERPGHGGMESGTRCRMYPVPEPEQLHARPSILQQRGREGLARQEAVMEQDATGLDGGRQACARKAAYGIQACDQGRKWCAVLGDLDGFITQGTARALSADDREGTRPGHVQQADQHAPDRRACGSNADPVAGCG